MNTVIRPTVRGMAEEGNDFTGFLYAGVMITADGTPKVLEFNVRFGDPETQPIMLRLKSDLVELCLAALKGHLDNTDIEWDERVALGVVLAAGGYPEDYRTGDVIAGLPTVDDKQCKVFHAGTRERDGNIVTAGGRVLCVCALGKTVAQAQVKAYRCVDRIHWQDCYYRTDIGYRAIGRES
jgi:phosphoribosylamine--glycine ligase